MTLSLLNNIPPRLSHRWCRFAVIFFLLIFASGVAQAFAGGNLTNTATQTTIAATPLENNILVVGSEQDYPPFAIGMTDATAGGFTVDLWKAVATEAGLKYTIRVLPFHDLLQEFKTGQIDVLINLAISKERHAFADFTVPHAVISGGIFVRKGESAIASEADFTGKSIIVLNADMAHDYAVSKGWGKQLVLVQTITEGMQLLASGKHDAMLVSKLAGMQTLQALELTNIKVLKTNAGFSQKFAFAVREGRSELFSQINEGLALVKANGTYAKLYEKWFGVYEVKEIGLRELLKYLSPIVLLFLGFAQYTIYRRNVERKQSEADLHKTQVVLQASQLELEAQNDALHQAQVELEAQNHELHQVQVAQETQNHELHQAQIALIDSRDRYVDLYEFAPIGYLSVSSHGMITEINWKATAMFGFGRKHLVQRRFAQFISDDDKARWQRQFSSLKDFAGGEELSFNLKFVHENGSIFHANLNCLRMDDEEDQPMLRITLVDITQVEQLQEAQRQANTKLIESESHLRAIIDNEPECIKIIDARGRLIQMNPAGLAMLEADTLDQVTGRSLLDFIVPKYHSAFIDLHTRVLAGESVQLEFEVVGLKGQHRWLETHAVPIQKNGENMQLGVTRDITERKQAEERIEKLISEQSAVLENRLVGFATVRDRKILWANLAFEIMHGYSKDELVGMPTRQLYVDDKGYALVGAAYAAMADDGLVRLQSEFLRKDGQHIWLNISGSMLNNETGESLWVFVDVTELKQAEDALAESHHLLKTIIDTAPMRIFWKDKDSRYLGCNPAFANDAGVASTQDIIGKDDSQMGWADQAELYRADDLAVMASGKAKLFYDEPQTTLTGQTIWLRTAKVPLISQDNETFGLLGIYEEITAQKLAEKELRIAATAFEAQEGMLVTDVNNVILRVNRAFTKVTGYSAEEAIGQTPHMLSSGHHDKDFYASMWNNINTHGVWEGEIWNRRKNGEVYPEHLTITSVKDQDDVITNYVATLTDITLNKAAAEEIHHLAFYDALTRLPNRRLLLDRLRQALAASARSGKDGAVLFLDLDHFKTLNDTLGHDIGDLLLQQVAERLTSCVREGDTVARLGGDEYVIMLEDLSEDAFEAAAQAEAIGHKIMTVLNQPYQLGIHEYNSTPSIGVTLFNEHHSDTDELLKQADIAMYQAKKSGRNSLRFFDPQMQESILSRVSLERELRKALEKNQFHLYYQIQVESSGRATGAEALIRWHHPERGLVSPFHFIPLAEETGLILPIGLWVLETACAQIKAWEQQALTRDLTLSINVSAKQFRQADFVAQVKNSVQNHAINPMLLKIELTESILLENIEDTIATMSALKEVGIRFSLDDFGTGYSSLQYLKLLPLYQLKIDQSFVRDIAVDSSDQAIVRTIIAMAHTLNLNVIAEGVETEEQQHLLMNNDCSHYQGYLFGRPVPIEQFEASLKRV